MFRHAQQPLIGLFALLLAVLACSMGAEPTAAPTLLPTETTFIILASPIAAGTTTSTPATATSAPTAASGGNTVPCTRRTDWLAYRVQSGDTLGTLAVRTGTTITVLAQANCLSNANLIAVGQIIYVPRVPMTVTPGGSVTPGTAVSTLQPAIQSVLIQPAVVQNQQYVVNAGPVIVLALGVANAAKVTFYSSPTASLVTPTELGTDTDLSNGASITWNVPDENLSLSVWAVATNAANRTVQSPPIVVVHTKSPTPTSIIIGPATAAQ